MKQKFYLQVAAWLVLMLALCSQPLRAVNIENGVSLELARYRAANISDVRYILSFVVPASKAEPVSFDVELQFAWQGDDDLQIDFQGDRNQLEDNIIVNGMKVETVLRAEHIIVPVQHLKKGENHIRIAGRSGDKALNRHDDYLYTLFVPDHARSAFPCFDQPDLKARFALQLTLPDSWVSISNDTQHPIPTYLFSFTAGHFQVQTATRNGREMTALYRETDPLKVAQLPIVFDQAALSLRWLEDYTGIPYPFEKYGFIVLPGYQFGGMEHPGCIQFTDWEIFLGTNPTPDEELARLNLIAHETSHMWFGDLVTMRWFDDVWTKEVFANFMADKISREQFPEINHDLAFVKAHYPAALSTDRTEGTHPIQQPLANLNQAGLLYGNIIYHKAPIMMRKLEQEKGADALQQGLRSYLRKYAYGNATWDDLVAELDLFAPEHSAQSFSDVWVKQKGLPVISYESVPGGIEIVQQDPYGRGLTWKQEIEVGQPTDDNKINRRKVYMDCQRVAMSTPTATPPILNYNGEGYGRFVIDDELTAFLCSNWLAYPDEMVRYGLVQNLYENYHMGLIDAELLFDEYVEFLNLEFNELRASTICSYLGTLMEHADASWREHAEQTLYNMIELSELYSVKQLLLRQLSAKATSPAVVDSLYAIWENRTAPSFNNKDYMQMAYHLAIMCPDKWEHILAVQRERLRTDDERAEFDFVSRACNPNQQVQLQLFDELLKVENRRVEPWARTMLALLNDPVREPFSNRYLVPGLDALEEIQRTGDIFFPGYWLSSLLSGHKSTEAKATVRTWIDAHPSLAPALMNKLKENAYWLITFPSTP